MTAARPIDARLIRPGEAIPAPNTAAAVACGLALVSLLPVALHQLGIIDHLPDPPGRIFDSGRITGSRAAHPFGVPDSLLGIGSYAATLALLLAARNYPKARPLLALKLTGDAGLATFNVVRQLAQFRRICSWCTFTALATGAMVCAARPLMRSAAIKAARPSR